MILCSGIHLSNGEALQCEFEENEFPTVGLMYTCSVSTLQNHNDNIIIDGHNGTHLYHKNDSAVNAITFVLTNLKYIPSNLGYLFNLTTLTFIITQLVSIRSKDFNGMQDLEVLSFHHNNLSSLQLDVFSTLTKLRVIFLSSNQIEEIQSGVFSNNINLGRIHLKDNKILFLGSGLFNELTKLYEVSLENNICVNNVYKLSTGIAQMKKDIKSSCNNPNDLIERIIDLQHEMNELKAERTRLKQVNNKCTISLLLAKEELYLHNVQVGSHF